MNRFLYIVIVTAMLCSSGSVAAPVTLLQSKRAAENWLRCASKSTVGVGRTLASVRTCSATNGVMLYVASLADGGFVALSSDTRMPPVIAFAADGGLVESDENPLWVLLSRNQIGRARMLAKTSERVSLMSAAPVPASLTLAERQWARLLSESPQMMNATFVDDERVSPFLQSKWAQDGPRNVVSETDWCYNYYTPNHWPCGCVATAGAQLMRYHEYPDLSVTVASYVCKVGTSNRTLTLKGGSYAWASMPYVTSSQTTEAQCKAIGKLTYDVGAACHTQYAAGGSGTQAVMLKLRLVDRFRYANAESVSFNGDYPYSFEKFKRAVLPNLNARLPVVLGIAGAGLRHAVLVDGYGYKDDGLFVHVNMGAAGLDDAWFLPPTFDCEDVSFTAIDGIVYNVYPRGTAGATVLSGRVLTLDGVPMADVPVSVRRGNLVVSEAATDSHGIYSFILPPGDYSVEARKGERSVTTNVTLAACVSSTYSYSAGSGTMSISASSRPQENDLYDADLVMPNVQGVATPAFSRNSGEFSLPVELALTCATPGAVIRYTLDGTEPTEISPRYVAPIHVDCSCKMMVRAFKKDYVPSSVVAHVFTYVFDPLVSAVPKGDAFADPVELHGSAGELVLGQIGSYTTEGGEWHTRYYREYHSSWYMWTAPGSGSVTFITSARAVSSSYYTALAVYDGAATSIAQCDQLAMSMDFQSRGDYATAVTLNVEQGRRYRIAGTLLSACSGTAAQLTIKWSGSLSVATSVPLVEGLPVSIPYVWFERHLLDSLTANPVPADYLALAFADSDGDGISNWKEYLCGTDPAGCGDLPRCEIEFRDGRPVLSHNIVVPAEAAALGWTAKLKGTSDLRTWDTADESVHRFFKVVVDQRQ